MTVGKTSPAAASFCRVDEGRARLKRRNLRVEFDGYVVVQHGLESNAATKLCARHASCFKVSGPHFDPQGPRRVSGQKG